MFMARDLRRYASQTNFRLGVGGILLLFVVGDGLIYLIYGRGAALMGLLCLLLGLAPLLVHTIFESIEEIHRQGTPVLLVEQNANAALKHSQRAYVLETGVVALAGTSEEVAANPKVKEAYLGE
jgi:branched-chain amino acid transport system ATP-binding protein